MKEFAALREKTYSYSIDNNNQDKKAKKVFHKTKTWNYRL